MSWRGGLTKRAEDGALRDDLPILRRGWRWLYRFREPSHDRPQATFEVRLQVEAGEGILNGDHKHGDNRERENRDGAVTEGLYHQYDVLSSHQTREQLREIQLA